MVTVAKNEYFEAIEESNKELLKLKGKWEIEMCMSGNYEIPSNILELEGVEYLLKLNIFNEVPVVLSFVAPYLFEYNMTVNTSKYSTDTKEAYVKKGSKLIENILMMYKEFNIDLKTSTHDLVIASKMYIQYLARCIGKAGIYDI